MSRTFEPVNNSDTFFTSLEAMLQANANAVNALQMEAYMKHIAPFYGVKSPQRKAVFKEVFAAQAPSDLQELDRECRMLLNGRYRELHYCGMELYFRKKRLWNVHSIETMEEFMMLTPWWDTIDFMAKNWVGEFVLAHPNEGMKKVLEWNDSGELWLIRTSILFQLGYKEKVDVEILDQMIAPHVKHPNFFIRKAIGWALRQYAKYDEDWVKDYVSANALSPLSVKEATKHIS